MAFTGCGLPEAVESATATVARLLRLRRKGFLRLGADADLLLLDNAANLRATFVHGELLYARDLPSPA
jgi:N-acetylglucosamine-6-phosphate deacetylase